MVKYAEFLQQNPCGVFATQEDGRLYTRVFQYLFADEHKVYFCTNGEKKVYAQLMKNAQVSFCTYPRDFSKVLSMSGEAVFVEDPVLKKRALDENPPIKEIFKSPDNPALKLFYIDIKEVETFSFEEGTKTYKL